MASMCAPERRSCQHCGRREEYDCEDGAWHTTDDAVGSVFCVHAWDITGAFVPLKR